MPRTTAHLALLVTALLSLFACNGPNIEVQTEATDPVDMTKMPSPDAENTTLATPIIDQVQPAKFETATFALG